MMDCNGKYNDHNGWQRQRWWTVMPKVMKMMDGEDYDGRQADEGKGDGR